MPVICIPDGGLCNRMRSIESAIALGERLGTPVEIYWNVNWQIRCRFEELFVPGDLTNHAAVSVKLRNTGRFSPWRTLWLAGVRVKALRAPVRWLGKASAAFGKPFVLVEEPEYKSAEELLPDCFSAVRDRDAAAARTRIVVYSGGWYGIGQSDFARWKPLPEIMARIDAEAAKLGDPTHTMGVHIRRTDNDVAIRESPDELFINRMRRQIERDPLTRFYLATDSEAVKDTFSREFGDRLTTPRGELSRGNLEGMRQAVVELYTLSRCSALIATWYSTFSRTAAAIAGIPLEVLRTGEKD